MSLKLLEKMARTHTGRFGLYRLPSSRCCEIVHLWPESND
jgi:hypothetical protein